MQIQFDAVAKALYIELQKRKVAKTKEFAPEVFLDFDYNGELIGIEMLESRALYLKKIAKKFKKPELAKVHPRVSLYFLHCVYYKQYFIVDTGYK